MGQMYKGMSFVLLGKTGVGKSATGNTILGRQAFKSEKSGVSVTKHVSEESGSVCGFPITVYDTPGLYDTNQKEQEIELKYQSIFQKCDSELCAFILVLKADRFTQEERKTVEKIEKLLGENRLKKTWIVFTRGDELEDEKKTLKQFINETEELKKLVEKYDQRYHLFNNKKKGYVQQVKDLLTQILKTCLKTVANGALKIKKVRKKLKPKHTRVSSLPSRRIVLVGKSGVGKSAAGNTILGKTKFRSKRSTKSVTSVSSVKDATVSGRSVSVVDTPGFFDTEMNPEELMVEIARSVYISSPGPHAFLIVLKVDDRFTEQEQQIPQMIEMLFGEEVLKYSIILFTRGDQLEEETVEDIIDESKTLKALVDQCGGRYQLFNNKDLNNREQVNDLLQKIDSMIQQNGGEHYSNQMYEDAQRLKQEEEEERLKEEEERKQQEENQKLDEIERVRKETEEKTRAECDAQNLEQKRMGFTEKFKQFLSKYKPYFYLAIRYGALTGAVIGGVVGAVGGFVVGGIGGAVVGAVGGAVVGAAVGGLVATVGGVGF